MTDNAHLNITTRLDEAAQQVILQLSGEIDVTAGQVFTQLETKPAMPNVVLDFSNVSRVNSMGLAQLMRLLEHWRCQRIHLAAQGMSHTVNMLFKMTGMNRYFGDNTGGAAASADTFNSSAARTKAAAVPSRSAPPQLRRVVRQRASPAPTTAETNPVASSSGKMHFAVSLQSNQQLTGWYYLNTLLQRALDRPISMSINQLGGSTALSQQALVFAKPFEACALISQHKFIPIVRPIDDSDEVSIIVRQTDAHKSLNDFAGAKVVTAVEANFVYLLGRFLCDEYGLDSASLSAQFTGNEITALKSLLNGEADMLFMLKKNYHQLSRLGREATAVLHESDTNLAYHVLLLAPQYHPLKAALTQAFTDLAQQEKGAQVLQDLGIRGWEAPCEDELHMLLMLYQRYVA